MASPATDRLGQDAFLEALKSVRDDSSSSDFQIVCGDITYNVHRLLISLHSAYFKRMCESGFIEAGSGRVTLQDDPPLAVKIMVDYFYTFQLSAAEEDLKELACRDGEPSPVLEILSWVFTLADKYDVPSLGNAAFQTSAACLALADEYPERLLAFFAGDLLSMTRHAFDNGPASDHRLRQTIVQRWINQDKKVLRVAVKEDFDQLVADVPDFASDLIATMSGITMKGKAESGK